MGKMKEQQDIKKEDKDILKEKDEKSGKVDVVGKKDGSSCCTIF